MNKLKKSVPIVANTTLTVLRLCGKYLQMGRLLKPIALDVILSMCQLFDYYLYNVYHFFTKDLVSHLFYFPSSASWHSSNTGKL